MRILVLEASEEYYHTYLLRLFAKLLPSDKLEFVHAPRLEDALGLLEQEWDIVLLGYRFPDSVKVASEQGSEMVVRNGGDWLRLRRAAERVRGLKKSFVIGVTSNQPESQALRLLQLGTTCYSKLQVIDIAKTIQGQLDLAEMTAKAQQVGEE